jgi:hypothetical protein
VADVKINFRISGADELRRAFDGITVKAQRGAAAAVRAQQTGAKESVAAARRAKNEMLTDAEALAKAEIALIQRVNRERVNAAKSQVQLQREAAAQQERILASQERAARASNRRRAAGEIGSGAASGFKAGAALIGGAVGISAVQSVRDQMSLDERAALLRNASGKSKAQFDSVAQAKKISNLTGVNAGEVMAGFEALSGKAGGGGLTEYVSQYEELAKVARGAGVSMGDLGNTLGTLYNRGVKADSVVKVVEALVQQGKDGAVEFNQLATLLDASSGALGRFKMDDATRVMSAGGLSQFARTFGKKSAEESTNAVEDLARDLAGKADDIQKLTGGTLTRVTTKGTKTKKLVNGRMVETEVGGGTRDQYAGGIEVGTTTDRAQLRDINQLLPDIIEGVVKSGNAGKLMGAGGIFTGNATAIAGPLLQAFTTGIKKNSEGRFELTKDGQAADMTGRAAVEALLKQFQAADVAPGSSQKAFDEVMKSSNAQLNQKVEKLRNDLGEKLAPIAAKAIENPKTAMAAVLAGSTALGAGNVLAGKAGTAILDKLFPKSVGTMAVTAGSVVVSGGVPGVPGGGGGGAPPVVGGGASKLVTALGVVGAGIGGLMMGKEIADGLGDKERKGLDSNIANASNLASRIRTGAATPEEVARAKALKGELAGEADKGFFGRLADGATAGVRGLASGDVSLANIASVLPPVAAMRGGLEAVGGGQGKGAAADAAAELSSALAKAQLKLDPASEVKIAAGTELTVRVSNASEIAGAGSLQGPKAQIEGQ